MDSCTAVLPFDYVSHNSAIVSCRKKKTWRRWTYSLSLGCKQSIIEVITVTEPPSEREKEVVSIPDRLKTPDPSGVGDLNPN